MPKRDGTGPMGSGAKTGRGLGPCDDENTATPFFRRDRADRTAGFGRGIGRGTGFGRGRGRRQGRR